MTELPTSASRRSQIVVGAAVQPGDLVRDRVPGGQQQNGGPDPFLADPFENGDPIEQGEHDVEDHQVQRLVLRQEQPLLAVIGDIHRIALFCETFLDDVRQGFFIFHNQQVHGLLYPFLLLRSRAAARMDRSMGLSRISYACFRISSTADCRVRRLMRDEATTVARSAVASRMTR